MGGYMNEILELQTNQVSFISGLMAGFSLTIAAQIIRHKHANLVSTLALLLFTLVSLLFVIALYIDVRLSIEVATIADFTAPLLQQITSIRAIGTASASIALFLFIIAIGVLSWLHSPLSGMLGSLLATICFILIIIAKLKIDTMMSLQ